jgi:starch phosphorylase
MTKLLTETIGDGWISDLSQISKLKKLAENPDDKFIKQWRGVQQTCKQKLIDLVETKTGISFNPQAMLSVQVKRIHEYKRQLLNVLHIIHLYLQIKNGNAEHWVDRSFLIGGKAAPGYWIAKQIIKLINNVAETINGDPAIGNRLRLAFIPNFRVSSMEVIAPGADLSEQISTAGKEASGTGNMKFMMNGALTIGTYDGANIEILEAVGEENFFLFGLRADEVSELRSSYNPQAIVDADPELKQVIDLLSSGFFNPVEPGIFDGILQSMLSPDDPWVTLADFRSYVDAQQRAAADWRDKKAWAVKSIHNVAACGFFSTDRTITDYNNDIWKLKTMQHQR